MAETIRRGDLVVCFASPFKPYSAVGFEHPMVGQIAVVDEVVPGPGFELFRCARWPGWWCSTWFFVAGRDPIVDLVGRLGDDLQSVLGTEVARPQFYDVYPSFVRRCHEIARVVGVRWMN